MLAVLPSATLHGLEGRLIRVEADVAPGLPGFTIVGLPDAAMGEARERVRGAIRNAGFTFPARRITINLAPADLRKAGASLDLAMALGVLLGTDQVSAPTVATGFIGELSLGGEIRPVPGILPMVEALTRLGHARIVVAAEAVDEARLVCAATVIGVATLGEAALSMARRRPRHQRVKPQRVAVPDRATDSGPTGSAPGQTDGTRVAPDLAEVRGQHAARRALEIALAGGHGLLLSGPPGVGKTLLARTVPGLLPPLDDAAALTATIVASAAGEGPIRELRRRPPFRAPHHTASYAAMVGGGPNLTPGEITRADGGVLFLDELAEFDRDVLESLRQPLEEGRVTIARAGRVTELPARFQLIAAMNPCPCGYAGSEPADRCACGPLLVERYGRRVSGPLRDRIDLWVSMARVAPHDLVSTVDPEPSAAVAARIAAARTVACGRNGGRLNARLHGRALRAACGLGTRERDHLADLATEAVESGRGTERVLRVARTIADLAGRDVVEVEHLGEAAHFRPRPGLSAQALAS